MESSVHGFDLMVADRYANDGVVTPQGRVSKQESSAAIKERAKRVAQGDAAAPTARGDHRQSLPGHLEDVAAGAELGAVTFGEAAVDVLHLSGDV